MTKDKITAYAKKEGYSGAEYEKNWRGYEVWRPTIDGATDLNPAIIGLPYVLLVRGEKIRMSTVDETFAYLDTFPDEE